MFNFFRRMFDTASATARNAEHRAQIATAREYVRIHDFFANEKKAVIAKLHEEADRIHKLQDECDAELEKLFNRL